MSGEMVAVQYWGNDIIDLCYRSLDGDCEYFTDCDNSIKDSQGKYFSSNAQNLSENMYES